MKKISIILVIFSFVLSSSIRADIRLGVKAGVNLANPSFNTDALQTSNFTGFQVGPIVEFTLPVVGLGMDAAIMYSQQGVQLRGLNLKKTQNTLYVPVNLKYKFGLLGSFGGYLTAGPYASFKLSGDDFSVTLDNIQSDLKSQSFGAGINFGGGFELLRNLQVGVNYQIGLTNDYKSFDTGNIDLKGKIRIWSITATFFF